MSNGKSNAIGSDQKRTRRSAIKALGGLSAVTLGTTSIRPISIIGEANAQEICGSSTDDMSPNCSGGGSTWPETDAQSSKIQRDEYGYTYTYRTSVGSYLDYLDSAFLAGKWEYVFLTQAHASGSKKNETTGGDPYQYEMFDGDHNITVKEKNRTSKVNTQYYQDADWGYGVTEDQNHDYSWGDATIDSIKRLEEHFNPVVASITAAQDVVDFWKKASADDDQYDGIDASFAQYYRTKTSGQYVRYFHRFPPAEDFPDSYVNVRTTNRINNTLYESNGTELPNGDYEKGWDYSIYVKSNPETSSASTLQSQGIVERKAGDVLSDARLKARGISPNEKIYVDKNPVIKVQPADN